jgi:hypothetical protein
MVMPDDDPESKSIAVEFVQRVGALSDELGDLVAEYRERLDARHSTARDSKEQGSTEIGFKGS